MYENHENRDAESSHDEAPVTHYEEADEGVDPSFAPEGEVGDEDVEEEYGSPSDMDYGQGQEEADDDPDDPEAERMARLMGWKPKEEWKGDTTNFVSAQEYLRRNARKFEAFDELEKKTQELDELKRKFVSIENRFNENEARQNHASLKQLEAARDEAFRVGDRRQFAALDQEIRKRERTQAQREYEERLRQQQQPSYDPDADTNFHKFMAENPWYGDRNNTGNAAKTYYAENKAAPQAYAEGLRPEIHGERFYARVSELVNEVYGQPSFGNQKNMPSQNTPRQPAKPRAPKTKGFSHLPQDAHQAFERLARKGVFENSDKGRAEYARMYFEENQE